MHNIRRWWPWPLAFFVSACGGSTTQPSGEGTDASASADVAASGDSALEAGLTDAGDGAISDSSADVLAGFLFFQTDPARNFGGFYAVFAGNPSEPSPCSVLRSDAACTVYSCDQAPGPVGVAGSLIISGGILDGGAVLDAGDSGAYEGHIARQLFAPGDKLSVAATGGSVPAFATQSVIAPDAVVLSTPALDGGSYSVATSIDLLVSWTGGSSASSVFVELSGVTTQFQAVSVQCSFLAASGHGTIPKEDLASIPGLADGLLFWGTENRAPFGDGPWSLVLAADMYDYVNASFH